MAVMLIGALVYGVHYSVQEYLCTFMVAGGVSVFAMKVSDLTPQN
jgi:UDP-galactose transporter B1